MNDKLFIADKIKVGFNLRPVTYTGKLAYVIGHDGKKWRKEPSWLGWIERYISPEDLDAKKREAYNNEVNSLVRNGKYMGYNVPNKPMTVEEATVSVGSYDEYRFGIHKLVTDPTVEPVEFDNVPTEGFVLNKKAGGYSSGWNHRATYCRVYDPRGFEIEINIPNLLFILGECNAMRGKGLEGTFVYAWDGKDLVLLPTTCQDYLESQKFTKLQSGKIGVKDLLEGCTYKTKNMDEMIYVGKFNWFSRSSSEISIKKNYVFYAKNKHYGNHYFTEFSSLSNFVLRMTDTPVSNYVEILDEFNKTTHSGLVTDIVEETYTPPTTVGRWDRNLNIGTALLPLGGNKFEIYDIDATRGTQTNGSYYDYRYNIANYNLKCNKAVVLTGNDFQMKVLKPKAIEKVTLADLNKMGLKQLKFKNNNAKITF